MLNRPVCMMPLFRVASWIWEFGLLHILIISWVCPPSIIATIDTIAIDSIGAIHAIVGW